MKKIITTILIIASIITAMCFTGCDKEEIAKDIQKSQTFIANELTGLEWVE